MPGNNPAQAAKPVAGNAAAGGDADPVATPGKTTKSGPGKWAVPAAGTALTLGSVIASIFLALKLIPQAVADAYFACLPEEYREPACAVCCCSCCICSVTAVLAMVAMKFM